MASIKPVACGPCQQEKLNTTADIWCNNCNEGLCSTCFNHHKKFRLLRDHKTIEMITFKSFNPSIGYIKTECDVHSQQFKLFCPSHLIPCCHECIRTHHSKCTGIKSLDSVVEKAKIEQTKTSVENDISSILLSLNNMANELLKNIEKGEDQRNIIKERCTKLREEINKKLYHLEKNLFKDADDVWSQEKSILTGLISVIEDKKGKLEEIQDELYTIEADNSKLQSFLRMHQIEQIVQQCQYVIDIENEKFSEVNIKIEQNDEIEGILSGFKTLKSFGKVQVVKRKITMYRGTSVTREAQIELPENFNINDMAMNLEAKINLQLEKMVSDIICLEDGRVIVVENESKVYLFTSDFKSKTQLPIPGQACCVTQINRDVIALTYPKEKSIKIFNLKDETISIIKMLVPCHGISCFNNSLAVGLINGEIGILDVKGNTLKSLQCHRLSSLQHLVYCNDRIIVSASFRAMINAVFCVDRSGKQIWKYTNDIMGPRGLCVDSYGNIIVVNYGSNSVIVIAKDGQDSKVLISKERGLNHPKLICINTNKCFGFIYDNMGTYLTKFNLLYE